VAIASDEIIEIVGILKEFSWQDGYANCNKKMKSDDNININTDIQNILTHINGQHKGNKTVADKKLIALNNIKRRLNDICLCWNMPNFDQIQYKNVSIVSGTKYYRYGQKVYQIDQWHRVLDKIANAMNTDFDGDVNNHAVEFLHPNSDYQVDFKIDISW
jgi:hypothetical protein